MADNKSFSAEQQKTSLAEKLWLGYMNSYLYENGIITESERNKVLAKIERRKWSTSSNGR